MLENPINSEKRLLSMRIIHENWNYPTHCSLIWCVLLKNEYYLHFLFIDKILEMNFICVSECRKYLDLEYFFLSEKNTNVVKSCLHIIWSHWSTMYFKIIFQNDSSSYVLFWVYIYLEKSGRLALDLTFFGSTIEPLLFLCLWSIMKIFWK